MEKILGVPPRSDGGPISSRLGKAEVVPAVLRPHENAVVPRQ
jgi:hypothetical protein